MFMQIHIIIKHSEMEKNWNLSTSSFQLINIIFCSTLLLLLLLDFYYYYSQANNSTYVSLLLLYKIVNITC